jgi:hypothetical protein
LQWSIEIAGSGSELKEFMCALVQHFHCPLSSNIISGVLKSFNSEELQREQWTVSSEQWTVKNYSNSDTRRVEFCLWARWTTMMSQSILFSLLKTHFHAHRLCYCGQPYLFLRFTYYVHSGLELFSMRITWQLLPQVKFRMCPSPDDSTSVRWRTILLCSAGYYWCPPLESPCLLHCHLDILPCYSTWLPSFVSSLSLSFLYTSSNFNPFCRL